MMSGKGAAKKKMAMNADDGDGDIVRTAQRAPRDAEERLDDDHENRGLDADEGRLDDRDLTEIGVDDAQAEHDDGARQHEEEAGGKPAQRAVQPPADIGGELHGLGARQQHAEVERMQETVLGDPPPLVDEHAMHQRDLAAGPPKDSTPILAQTARASRKVGLGDGSIEPMAAHCVA